MTTYLLAVSGLSGFQPYDPRCGVLRPHPDCTVVEPGPVHQLEVEYLVNGTVPTVTNSTLYTVSLPASEPGAILDPYEVAVGPEAGDVYPGSVDNTQSAE